MTDNDFGAVAVDVYDSETYELLGSFDSQCKAAKFCGGYPGGVSRGIRQGYKVNGYIVVKHGDIPKPPEIKQQTIARKVYKVYNMVTKEFLGSYLTQRDLARAFGISTQSVSWAIKNNKPTHGVKIEVEEDEN